MTAGKFDLNVEAVREMMRHPSPQSCRTSRRPKSRPHTSRDGATLESMAERSQSESQIPRSVAAYLADFLAVGFLAVVFCAVVFLAVVFLGAAFFTVTFLAVVFLAVVFLGASFFADAFLAVVFRAMVFLAGLFFAEALGAGSRPVIFLAAETTALTMFPPISVMTAP
jgi:hypothetical protein